MCSILSDVQLTDFAGDNAARALHAALNRFEGPDNTLDELHALVDRALWSTDPRHRVSAEMTASQPPTKVAEQKSSRKVQRVILRTELIERYLESHDAVELAAAAKLDPKTVSRAKNLGTCSPGSARRLAQVMGLKYFDLVVKEDK